MNTPSKKDCRVILDKMLEMNEKHEDVGPQVAELRKHLMQREADKSFYLMMIRHFDEVNDIL